MALRGTLTHRKIRRLAALLHISPCFALGVAESLWHVTAEQAPTGAIGIMRDEDIAMEMFYDGEPEVLIEAMLAAGLLERSDGHRLIVHDWHIHSDDSIDNKLSRRGARYANGEMPRMRRMSKVERGIAKDKMRELEFPVDHESVRTNGHAMPDRATNSHNGALPEPEPEPVLKTNNNLTLSEDRAVDDVVDDKDKKLSAPKKALRKQQRAAVERLFTYYLKGTERNPKMYELTHARMEKGLSRLEDCQRKCNGDLVKAEKLMGLAIDALLASEFHSGNNDRQTKYNDWIAHLFKSTEKLEWWLAK